MGWGGGVDVSPTHPPIKIETIPPLWVIDIDRILLFYYGRKDILPVLYYIGGTPPRHPSSERFGVESEKEF